MSQTILKKERDPSILILDFGSQYSELIARRIRETNVFSLVVSNCISIEEINSINPKGIILSGGPNSVYEENAPKCNEKIFNFGGNALTSQSIGPKILWLKTHHPDIYQKAEKILLH